MYEGYFSIADAYDRFNAEIDYERWSGFIEACFDRYLPERPQIVLDLACGTGRMTFSLANRGYDMIGIDASADMLAKAYERNAERSDRLFEEACRARGIDPEGDDIVGMEAVISALAQKAPPLFLQQDMRDFELYGTVDATVCCLDSLNYLCDNGDLDRCLACIHLYLAPGGLLVFDVNTPYKFEYTYGENTYILEDSHADGRSVFCGWQNDYDPENRLCRFYLSVFTQQPNGAYDRTDEEQVERCYTEHELKVALDQAGFDLCGIFSDFDFTPPARDTERWYIVARTRKRGDWYLCK